MTEESLVAVQASIPRTAVHSLLGLLSFSNRTHLWVIDALTGRTHTLAASHVLLGGLPTSAAELMSIMPTEESLSLGIRRRARVLLQRTWSSSVTVLGLVFRATQREMPVLSQFTCFE